MVTRRLDALGWPRAQGLVGQEVSQTRSSSLAFCGAADDRDAVRPALSTALLRYSLLVVAGAYHELFTRLHEARIHYAIAGGFAVVLHGVPRMTFDLDLVVDPSDDNMAALVDTLARAGYRPRLPVPLADLADASRRREWVEERNLIAFSLHHPERPMEEVDLLLSVPLPWSEIARTVIELDLAGLPVVVVGRSALRAMKLATGREKDRVDAELLGAEDA